MAAVSSSEWGTLFANWESQVPDERGFPTVGRDAAVVPRTGLRAFASSLGILGTTLREAPELAARRPAGPRRASDPLTRRSPARERPARPGHRGSRFLERRGPFL